MVTITGGDKVEKVLKDIVERLGRPGSVAVGFFEDATYPDGTPVAMVAAIQNYGAPAGGIPPRPFFSNMIADKSPEWPAAIAGLIQAGDDTGTVLRKTGAAIAGQLQQSIRDTNTPALAQSTIDRKGFAKPLIDTGQMINSVDYQVNDD